MAVETVGEMAVEMVGMTAVETVVAWAKLTTTVVMQRAICTESKHQQQWRWRQHGQPILKNNN